MCFRSKSNARTGGFVRHIELPLGRELVPRKGAARGSVARFRARIIRLCDSRGDRKRAVCPWVPAKGLNCD